jgi:putative transposase
MGSTYSSLYYHFVWGTKDRRNLIAADWEPRLHAWLGGAIRNLGGVPDLINGMGDHVHLLVGLRATHAPAKLVRDIKGGSSEWVRSELQQRLFGWQEGYFVATVSPTQLDGVRRYIHNQKQHHKKWTWLDELKDFLNKAGVKYDPKYLL